SNRESRSSASRTVGMAPPVLDLSGSWCKWLPIQSLRDDLKLLIDRRHIAERRRVPDRDASDSLAPDRLIDGLSEPIELLQRDRLALGPAVGRVRFKPTNIDERVSRLRAIRQRDLDLVPPCRLQVLQWLLTRDRVIEVARRHEAMHGGGSTSRGVELIRYPPCRSV